MFDPDPRWLLSGVIRGVGPAMTERILDTFGDRTHEVIEALAEPGIDLAQSELLKVRSDVRHDARDPLRYQIGVR